MVPFGLTVIHRAVCVFRPHYIYSLIQVRYNAPVFEDLSFIEVRITIILLFLILNRVRFDKKLLHEQK